MPGGAAEQRTGRRGALSHRGWLQRTDVVDIGRAESSRRFSLPGGDYSITDVFLRNDMNVLRFLRIRRRF